MAAPARLRQQKAVALTLQQSAAGGRLVVAPAHLQQETASLALKSAAVVAAGPSLVSPAGFHRRPRETASLALKSPAAVAADADAGSLAHSALLDLFSRPVL